MQKKEILHDRNILITNNTSHFALKLASQLCELGANILLAGKETRSLERFCESFMEQREIYPHFGRLHIMDFDKTKTEEQRLVFQKASEYFGGVNSWLDLSYFHGGPLFGSEDFLKNTTSFFNSEVLPLLAMYQEAIGFLKAKRNSSVIRLSPEDKILGNPNSLNSFIQAGLHSLQQQLHQNEDSDIRFLSIAVGPTEDYLLSKYPNLKVNEALTEYQKSFPKAELIDAEELAYTLAFLIGDNRTQMRISNLSLTSR